MKHLDELEAGTANSQRKASTPETLGNNMKTPPSLVEKTLAMHREQAEETARAFQESKIQFEGYDYPINNKKKIPFPAPLHKEK